MNGMCVGYDLLSYCYSFENSIECIIILHHMHVLEKNYKQCELMYEILYMINENFPLLLKQTLSFFMSVFVLWVVISRQSR